MRRFPVWNNLLPNFGVKQIAGFFAGCGVVAAGLVFHSWVLRRRREGRSERPPQQEKLLRPPGHSLQIRISCLEDEADEVLVSCLAAGGIFGLACAILYPLADPVVSGTSGVEKVAAIGWVTLFSLLALLAGILIWLARNVKRWIELQGALRNVRFGLRGEQAVAETLFSGEVARAGYTIFNDVPGTGPWNVDHVAVGPGGIFVLETKTRSRRKATREQEEHRVVFDGTTLCFPWGQDQNAAKQAARNAAWISEFIRPFAPSEILIIPVIILPGWWVETKGNFPVKAMNAKYLKKQLCSSEQRFTPEQLRPVLARLDERCRDVEF